MLTTYKHTESLGKNQPKIYFSITTYIWENVVKAFI